MLENINEVFERNAHEYCKFERVEDKLHKCPDICAMIKLSSLAYDDIHEIIGHDIVSCASRDLITLSVGPDELKNTTTEDDIIMLIRCGVSYDDDQECFVMQR
jgi:hypothetical protein